MELLNIIILGVLVSAPPSNKNKLFHNAYVLQLKVYR